VRLATIKLHAQEYEFSAGHFTIFSATEREDMHGHNYSVSVAFEVTLHDNGMAFDYRIYKKKLKTLCDMLDRRFLLPNQSKFLTLEDAGDMWIAYFNQERIPFLKRDVVILPICNVTIEELSHWFLQHLVIDKHESIQNITVNVFNGPGQSGASSCGKRNYS
jgi:6-pyruvoyltetrahydropterin/6-carboxytetrahydropterin synthase